MDKRSNAVLEAIRPYVLSDAEMEARKNAMTWFDQVRTDRMMERRAFDNK